MRAVVGSFWIALQIRGGHFPVPPTPRLVLVGDPTVAIKQESDCERQEHHRLKVFCLVSTLAVSYTHLTLPTILRV